MSAAPTAESLIRTLALAPLPGEGWWFAETWRSPLTVDTPRGRRAAGTAIWYLVTPPAFSALHRLPFDEVFHWYLGDAVEMLLLAPGGGAQHVRIGPDVANGERPQVRVPGDVWQGTRLAPGGRVALLGTTMAPGFDPSDYAPGDRAELLAGWPDAADAIRALTR